MRKIALFIFLSAGLSAWAQSNIADARSYPIGSTVTISGIVSNGSELGDIRYLEDGSAGIACYPGSGSVPNFTPFRGELVQVTGILDEFNGLLQVNPITSYNLMGSGTPPAPKVIKASEVGERTEGQLVRFDHSEFFNKNLFFTSNTWRFTSLGRSTQIYLGNGHELIGTSIPEDFVSVVGIVSQYNANNGIGGYQILPRDSSDLLKHEPVQMTTRVRQRNTTQSAFEIYWSTTKPCPSFVEYGASPAMGNFAIDTLPRIDHSITVDNLPVAGLWQYLRVGNVLGTDTVYSTVNRHTSMFPSNDITRLWFSQPVNNSVSQGSNATFLFDALDDTLVAYMNLATSTLDVAMYNNTSQTVINAVNDAYTRGVQVRFIAEGQNSNTVLGNLNPNIPVHYRMDGMGSGMHNKFVVIDAGDNFGAWVLQGSSNWTSSLFGDANNQFAIQNRSLAEIYTAEFNEMWGGNTANPNANLSLFGHEKFEQTPHFLTINGDEVEVYFSPTESVTDRIIEVINSAEDDIHFATFSFTEDNIRNAMIQADPNLPGRIHGMIEQVGGSELFTLQSAGIDVASTGNFQGLLHHKYLIADKTVSNTNPTVITGSHNFSFNAATVNDENILIYHSASITDQFYQDWRARKDEVVGIDENSPMAVTLFPNPSEGLIYFSSPVERVTVFDATGRIVLESRMRIDVVDLQALASGLYQLAFVVNEKSYVQQIQKL